MANNDSNSNQGSNSGNQSGTQSGNTGQQSTVVNEPIPIVPQQDRTVIEKGDKGGDLQK